MNKIEYPFLNRVVLLWLFGTVIFGISCTVIPDEKEKKLFINPSIDSMVVMFYNVENLFDIYDDPHTQDDDFTPTGKLRWTQQRYLQKIKNLVYVIDAIPGDLPAIVGFAEVENRAVLEDMLKEPQLGNNYSIVHKDSPDTRGMDVAAIVDTTRMTILKTDFVPVILGKANSPHTRDILYMKARSNSEDIHFFVNHWPSRREGQEESEINRIEVAMALNRYIEGILKSAQDAKIVIMGDFNDYPDNKSIHEVLNAGISRENAFHNYMYEYHTNREGSYWYQGAWGTLDQFITSLNMGYANRGWTTHKAFIYEDDKLMFTDKNGNRRPDRTYSGLTYIGAFSDHLPIYLPLYYIAN